MRKDSERLLVHEKNGDGSFLVRLAETKEVENHVYSLSLLTNGGKVKHYRIFQSDQGLFYMNDGKHFKKLSKLIRSYQINGAIRLPCFRVGQSYNVFCVFLTFIKILI